MKILGISLIVLSFVVSGCDEVDEYIKNKAPTSVDSNELVILVNDVRKSGYYCGDVWYPAVQTIRWSSHIQQASQIHCNDMSENDIFEHEGTDGSSPGDRLLRVGYNWSTYGENIATGFSEETEVMQAWLDSPGHCKNIMNGSFTEMGVATKNRYWTQDFALAK